MPDIRRTCFADVDQISYLSRTSRIISMEKISVEKEWQIWGLMWISYFSSWPNSRWGGWGDHGTELGRGVDNHQRQWTHSCYQVTSYHSIQVEVLGLLSKSKEKYRILKLWNRNEKITLCLHNFQDLDAFWQYCPWDGFPLPWLWLVSFSLMSLSLPITMINQWIINSK